MSKHKRRTRGESSGASNSQEKCITWANSFGSTDDVFYATQSHRENEFRKGRKITKSQMRGKLLTNNNYLGEENGISEDILFQKTSIHLIDKR